MGILVCVLLMGCVSSGTKDLERQHIEKSIVVGFIQVEPTVPYFRKHQTEPRVHFFDMLHDGTGERVRVHVEPESKRFVTELDPGAYEIFRIQISEGPFRSEAHVKLVFQVSAEKIAFVGLWQLRVDTPKTVRMLHWNIVQESLDTESLATSFANIVEKPMAVSLPQPMSLEARLFPVAPSQPRAKYFYRR